MGNKAAALTLSQYPHLEDIPKGLAEMASIHQKGTLASRIAIQRMERRPVVSHSRNPAALDVPDFDTVADLRGGTTSDFEGTLACE